MFTNLGSAEILVVILVLVFLFGGKKLPEIAKNLGASGKELKKAKGEIEKAIGDTFHAEDNTEEESNSTMGSKKGGDQV